jgi:hydrogenase maturation protease
VRRAVILGVGNPVLTDDAVGLHVAGRAREILGERPDVVVRESERGGLDLVELLEGFDVAVLVDALLAPGRPAGSILRLDVDGAGATTHLHGAHGVDLPTAVALGRRLGVAMPARVWIVGVVVEDALTLGEALTPAVAESVEPAAALAVALARAG